MNNDETTELGGRARRTTAAIAVLVAAARRLKRRPTAHQFGERRIRVVEIEDAGSIQEQEPQS